MKRLASLLAAALAALAVTASGAQAEFGFTEFDLRFAKPNGAAALEAAALEAGAHPFAVITDLTQESHEEESQGKPIIVPDGDIKDLIVAQIPGLVGNPTAVERCTNAEFFEKPISCPNATQLGVAEVEIGATEGNEGSAGESGRETITNPVYNLNPPPGVAAKIGFMAARVVPVTIDLQLNPTPPYNVIARLTEIGNFTPFLRSELTIWGVPADPAHDHEREPCLHDGEGSCPLDLAEEPFLTSPRACLGPLATNYAADSWQSPGAFLPGGEPDLSDPAWLSGFALTHDDSTPPNPQGFTDCGNLGFGPTIEARPTSRAATSPTGLDFSLDVKDENLTSPTGNADSDIEEAIITLPQGMTANPSLAEGLEVCGEADLEEETAFSAPGAGCPEASKVGTVEVQTPLLEETLGGSLFIAEPYANRADNSLIALYMVIKSANLGIVVKQALKVEPDPITGQLVTIAKEIPQLPFAHLRVHLREGGRSPLISPPSCGAHTAAAELHPYSGAPPLTTTSTFQITSGPNEGPCPQGGAPSFAPGFQAGTLNNSAGRYSPFFMRLTRKDAEQDMTRFSAVLPPGVLGKIAGLDKCSEAEIAAAKARSGAHVAAEELASPSCLASSRIGRTVAGAGVGSQLTWVPGSLYLAGPIGEDPLSVVAITPAKAGPFDAGVVVVRVGLKLNPRTAEVETDGSTSDPIPHILKGIPLNLRDLRVYADKPEFTLNATSCAPSSARATLFGSFLNVLDPSDDRPVDLKARYQAASCASLGFKPKLEINLKGGTKRGDHPALKAIVTPRPGDANFAKAVVTLPRSAFLDQAHIRTICTRVQFAADGGHGAGCPKGSIYGKAKAWSPLLEEPLAGPVYLRSSNHNLPDLVIALHGIVEIELSSRIDSHKGGIRSTFADIPDAPVSRFVLEMQGGRKGLIVNSRDLCAGTSRASADLEGQNGKRRSFGTVVGAGCGKGGGR